MRKKTTYFGTLLFALISSLNSFGQSAGELMVARGLGISEYQSYVPTNYEGYRQRVAYHALLNRDERMQAVLSYCMQKGRCEGPIGSPEQLYLKGYLRDGSSYSLEKEKWKDSIESMKPLVGLADALGKGVKVGNKSAGEAAGDVLKFVADHPPGFFVTPIKGVPKLNDQRMNAKEIVDATGVIVKNPMKRLFVDSLTEGTAYADSSDNREIPQVKELNSSTNTEQRVNELTKETQKLVADQKKFRDDFNKARAELKEQGKKLDKITKDIDERKELARNAERDQKKLEEFEFRQANINAGFALLSMAVGIKDQKAARVIQALGQVSNEVMQINKVAAGLAKDPGKLVMMTNIFTAVIAVAQAAQEANAEQKFREAVMEQFKFIREQLAQLHEKMDQMNATLEKGVKDILDDLYRIKSMNQLAQTSLNELHARVVKSEMNIRGFIQESKFSDWSQQYFNCVDSADKRTSGQPSEAFRSCFDQFYWVSVNHSKNSLWTTSETPVTPAESVTTLHHMVRKMIYEGGGLNDINFLSTKIKKYPDFNTSGIPKKIPNIGVWNFGANAFANVCLKRFDKNDQAHPETVQEVLSLGLDIHRFFQNTIGSNEFMVNFANSYQSKYDNFANHLKNLLGEISSNAQKMPIFTLPDRKVPPQIAGSNVGIIAPTDDEFRKIIPQTYLMAAVLGLGKFNFYYGWHPVDTGISVNSNVRIPNPWSRTTFQRISTTIHIEFLMTGSTNPLPVARRERISKNFGHNSHLPAPNEASVWMWNEGKGEGLTGPSKEDPMHVNFADNSTELEKPEDLSKALAIVDFEVRKKLKESILAAMPVFNPEKAAQEGTIPGVVIDQNQISALRAEYDQILEQYKVLETLGLVSDFYLADFPKTCLPAIFESHPNKFLSAAYRKEFNEIGDLASGFASKNLLLALEDGTRARCFVTHVEIPSLTPTISKLAFLLQMSRPAGDVLKDIQGMKKSTCPHTGLSQWKCFWGRN